MAVPARVEREALCKLLLDAGPDAPTLCGDWTTRDLAAHLVVRERRPDTAIGAIFRPLAEHGEKVRFEEAARDYAEIVGRVRTGPRLSPTAVPAVDRLVNTVEFYVHHEDVRRASAGWEPRALDPELEDDLYSALTKGARILARKAPAGLVLQPPDRTEIVAKRAGPGEPTVRVSGALGELVLFVYGRQAQSIVEIDGPDDAVEAVRTAALGL